MFQSDFSKFTIICGHYGCGKTNLTLNIAADLAGRGHKVCVVDLDIVNPYFRSSDYDMFLEERGIKLISPKYARTSVDAPALSAEINSIFEFDGYVLIDAGGDDAGATALGRYSAEIRKRPYEMLYVINKNRPLTGNASEAVTLLREIEGAAKLRATGIINNSHLMTETSAGTIKDALDYAKETASELGLPLKFTTAPCSIAKQLDIESLYPVEIYVKTPWAETN